MLCSDTVVIRPSRKPFLLGQYSCRAKRRDVSAHVTYIQEIRRRRERWLCCVYRRDDRGGFVRWVKTFEDQLYFEDFALWGGEGKSINDSV